MKKRGLMGLLAVGLLVGLLLPASVPVLAAPEDDAQVQTLYAGQDIDVGVVKVWNDIENLYVKYETTGGWVMTRTHMEVVCHSEDFPMTKKGSPKVGHFTYGEALDPAATEWCQTIPLDDLDCTLLHIAAHAEVARPLDGCTEEVWMIGDVEEVNQGATPPQLTCYYDEFNYSGDVAQVYPLFDDPFVMGTLDTSFPWNSNPNRMPEYAADFKVEWTGALLFGGTLTLSWSPGGTGSETKIVTADTGETGTWMASGARVAEGLANWNGYPLVENTLGLGYVPDGSHWLQFRQTTGNMTLWDWIKLEKPCEQWESAWAGSTRFVGKGNWARCFEYELQSVLVETVVVPPTGVPVSSVNALVQDESYELVAKGTYMFTGVGALPTWGIADAKYSKRPVSGVWLDGAYLAAGFEYYLQVVFESTPPLDPVGWEWSGGDVVNMAHEYTASKTGDGSAVSFQIWDNNYNDNSGFLTVEIWWTP